MIVYIAVHCHWEIQESQEIRKMSHATTINNWHPPVLLSSLAAETGSWAGGSGGRLDHMKVGLLPSRTQAELRCRSSSRCGPQPGWRGGRNRTHCARRLSRRARTRPTEARAPPALSPPHHRRRRTTSPGKIRSRGDDPIHSSRTDHNHHADFILSHSVYNLRGRTL